MTLFFPKESLPRIYLYNAPVQMAEMRIVIKVDLDQRSPAEMWDEVFLSTSCLYLHVSAGK